MSWRPPDRAKRDGRDSRGGERKETREGLGGGRGGPRLLTPKHPPTHQASRPRPEQSTPTPETHAHTSQHTRTTRRFPAPAQPDCHPLHFPLTRFLSLANLPPSSPLTAPFDAWHPRLDAHQTHNNRRLRLASAQARPPRPQAPEDGSLVARPAPRLGRGTTARLKSAPIQTTRTASSTSAASTRGVAAGWSAPGAAGGGGPLRQMTAAPVRAQRAADALRSQAQVAARAPAAPTARARRTATAASFNTPARRGAPPARSSR